MTYPYTTINNRIVRQCANSTGLASGCCGNHGRCDRKGNRCCGAANADKCQIMAAAEEDRA